MTAKFAGASGQGGRQEKIDGTGQDGHTLHSNSMKLFNKGCHD
jgi:hypothetical protein